MIKFSLDRRAIEQKFGKIRSLDGTPDPVKQSARFFRQQIATGFAEQRDPWGEPWQPLADSTLAIRRARKNFSTRILEDTTTMRRSLRVRDDTVEIRFPAVMHQNGGWIRVFGKGRALLPRRAIMPIDEAGEPNPPDAWMEKVVEFFRIYLEK